MEFETLTFEVRDGVGHLRMNRPANANALNAQLALDLRNAVVGIERDLSVRAVVWSAEGRIFSGGGDLAAFSTAAEGMADYASNVTIDLHAAISRMAKLNQPIVTAVQGAAGGAGMSMVAASDLVVAGESAKFTMGYTKAGLVPDGSSSFFLSRVVGLRRAMELVLTNRVLSAAEALDWGLVNWVVPDDEIDAKAAEIAGQLAKGPTLAFGGAKKVIYEGANSSLEAAMERESMAIVAAMGTADGHEGVAAFLEKRSAEFRAE